MPAAFCTDTEQPEQTKVLQRGGASRPAFGGEVLEPIEIYLGGRAAMEYRGASVPAHEIAVDACREWLAAQLPNFDAQRDALIAEQLAVY